MAIAYKRKTKKRKKKHGFLKRQKTKAGKRIIKKRRARGRKKLAV